MSRGHTGSVLRKLKTMPIIAIKDGLEIRYDNIKSFLEKHPELNRQRIYDVVNPNCLYHHSHNGYTFRFVDERYNIKRGYVCPQRSNILNYGTKD